MKKTLLVMSCSLLVAACASAPSPSGPSANAVMRPATGSQVHGNVTFTEVGNGGVRVNAELAALSSGLNTLRLHEKGDCSKPDASSAGVLEREIGPLIPDEYGKAVATYTIAGTAVGKSTTGLLGRGVIVQQGKDRIACGSIE